ncbi:c-type cytochrome [Pseudomonas sp. RT4P38]
MVYRHAVILAALLLICATAVADAQRQAQLEHLLTQDCGACHGLHLTGGLGPELTRAALAGKSRDNLIATVTQGRPGTAMPGWAPLLSPDDIRWLVDFLLQGYPAP